MVLMNGITRLNKHSYKDFDVILKSKAIGTPKKNKIKDSVPFMNGSYDFSELYECQTYGERTLKYVFIIIGETKTHMNIKKISLLNWLYKGGKEPLFDDSIPGYYFLAECEDDDFQEDGAIGELTVTFNAYPFKICTYNEGNILFDNFNFLTDVLQETSFYIEGSKIVNIINQSAISIEPTIIVNGKFNINHNGKVLALETGSHKNWRFKLKPGENIINIYGNGYIEFQFRKEVL